MKNFPPSYAQHLNQRVTTLAICWRIEKKNGDVILGTDHDRDIRITETNIGVDISGSSFSLDGVYKASSGVTGSDVKSNADMSVSNMEVQGALASHSGIVDLSVDDIEAGLLDSARVITFRVNWQDPDEFQELLRFGFLGEITRTAEGTYRTEVRGLEQILQQTIGRTCGDRCDVAEFGDARCKINVAALTVTGTVTSVTSRRRFDASLTTDSSTPDSPYFRLGRLTFTSGANQGFTRQVKLDNVGDVLGNLEMWEPFPRDVEIGDTFTLTPGCDRRYETCRDVHNNLVNFRGPGIFTPGMDEIIRAP
jgi:uncharacterized phage protein (TIGR02218 family)